MGQQAAALTDLLRNGDLAFAGDAHGPAGVPVRNLLSWAPEPEQFRQGELVFAEAGLAVVLGPGIGQGTAHMARQGMQAERVFEAPGRFPAESSEQATGSGLVLRLWA
jgi:hypothetical protein